MNNTLRIAYKILYALEYKKKTEYSGALISPEKLGVDADKWLEVLESLVDEGYISSVFIEENIMGETDVDIESVKITLKGAEYLRENNVMRGIAKIATNVITIAKP